MSRDPADMRTPSPSSQKQGPGQDSFFVRERERLVAEIAESLGQVLNNSNALNRKLEESILVGKEFEPVAALWGRFASMMSPNGLIPQGQTDGAGANEGGCHEGNTHSASTRTDHGPANALQTPCNLHQSVHDDSGEPAEAPRSSVMSIVPGGGTWTRSGDRQT